MLNSDLFKDELTNQKNEKFTKVDHTDDDIQRERAMSTRNSKQREIRIGMKMKTKLQKYFCIAILFSPLASVGQTDTRVFCNKFGELTRSFELCYPIPSELNQAIKFSKLPWVNSALNQIIIRRKSGVNLKFNSINLSVKMMQSPGFIG